MNIKGKAEYNTDLSINIMHNILQFIMGGCLLYLAYKLVYRPLNLGVDILPYTLADCSIALLLYGFCDNVYNITGLKYTLYLKDKLSSIKVSTLIILTTNLVLAVKVAPTIYYNMCYLILLFSCAIFSTLTMYYTKRHTRSNKV